MDSSIETGCRCGVLVARAWIESGTPIEGLRIRLTFTPDCDGATVVTTVADGAAAALEMIAYWLDQVPGDTSRDER